MPWVPLCAAGRWWFLPSFPVALGKAGESLCDPLCKGPKVGAFASPALLCIHCPRALHGMPHAALGVFVRGFLLTSSVTLAEASAPPCHMHGDGLLGRVGWGQGQGEADLHGDG